MKFRLYFIVAFMALTSNAFGQEESLQGQVSFLTSKNIYVKFDDTTPIHIGDTLQLEGALKPCLVVRSKSSSSCVSVLLEGCEVQKGDSIIFLYSLATTTAKEREQVEEFVPIIADADEITKESLYKENIRGRLSASSYSTIASDREDRHRLMSRLSLNATHINNSRFSFNTYLNYRHILDQQDSTSLQNTSFFRVFNLGVRYEASPSLSLVAGRNINPKTSSLGAIDGLQLEKNFGKSYVGIVGGFRPDIFNYGFNADLLQYGGYLGHSTNSKKLYSQTTLGFIQQQNKGEIDRRYAYFQHSSTVLEKLNLFSSLELDMFSKLNDEVTNEIRLTNFYVSARYRFSRKINLMLSFDSRKRILYYETFQTEIERLLNNDLARQGVRARLNIRPFKKVLAGFSYGKRFQSDNQNKSDNLNGFISWSRLPTIGGRLNLSYNRNESNYLESNIASLRHSRVLLRNKLYADFYYRFVHYKYSSISDVLQQHYAGANMSFNITRRLLVSVSGEWTTYNKENNYRIYTRIVQRLNSKRKK